MPSKSPAQHRLMEAAAHTKGGFGGVSQKVGKEFANADKNKKFSKGGLYDNIHAKQERIAHGMAGPMKDEKGRPTRKAASLRRWHCADGGKVKKHDIKGW